MTSVGDIRALSDPKIQSAEIKIDKSEGPNDDGTVTVSIDASFGLGAWTKLFSIVMPTEEVVEFPAGEGSPAIFNPTKSNLLQTYEIIKILGIF